MQAKDEVKRLKEFDKFVQLVIADLYKHVEKTPKDGKVRAFTGTFYHNDLMYNIECDFKLKAEFFQILRIDIRLGDRVIYTTDKPKMGKTINKEILLN